MNKKIIKIGIAFLNILYSFYKLAGQNNQLLIVSRQSDEPSIDIRLIKAIIENVGHIDVKVMCRHKSSDTSFDLSYFRYMSGPLMREFARSKVVLLDGYCIPASILKHRRNLKIVQMWHAMGAFKKFGYELVGKQEGHSEELAQLMRMHKNYDYVLVSSKACIKPMSRAFGCDESIIKVLPPPKVDFIKWEPYKLQAASDIKSVYDIQDKKLILYAPTFRRDGREVEYMRALADAIDYDKYNLVIKPHPISEYPNDCKGAILDRQFSSTHWLSVCDAVVTDYSAFILEAAISGKPIYRFVPDIEEYEDVRGFFDGVLDEFPGEAFKDAAQMIRAIDNQNCDMDKVAAFADKYLEDGDNAAREVVIFLESLVDEE